MDTNNNQSQYRQPDLDDQVQQSVVNMQKPQEPDNPVGGMGKEMGPIAEYIAPASPHEIEPVLPTEVKEAGVESVSQQETPKVTDDQKKLGVTLAPAEIPVSMSSSMAIQIPYTYPQLQQKVKETPVDDSGHWLAVLYTFILERLGIKG